MKKGKNKDLFPTRQLTVHDGDWPGPKVVIQHDMTDFIRETFSLDEKKQDKPAEVIPLKRDRH